MQGRYWERRRVAVIEGALLSMLNPVIAILGIASGLLTGVRVALGTVALFFCMFVATFGLIPIMIPATIIALAAWAAIGYCAALGFRRARIALKTER